jgi:apolipoprotein N-acyltransferase
MKKKDILLSLLSGILLILSFPNFDLEFLAWFAFTPSLTPLMGRHASMPSPWDSLPASAPHQHFTIAVFRAVENRVFIARAANTGITGFIHPKERL